ncbi:MAG: metal ABC transporter permease [Verrucomicrobia bacterium]|nr:metal ABC transporter permease [Verrucomicrobiota bacterium]
MDLLVPFRYDFMVTAMWVCTLVGVVCGLLSAFVTLKGWSLMGDALSHAVVPGVAIAYFVGMPFALGAFASGILAAGAMTYVKLRTPVREDAVIGVVFTSFFAFGLLLISLRPSQIDLKTIILGNVLGIPRDDALQVTVVSAICLLVLALQGRDLLLVCFDPGHARALGLRVNLLQGILLTLLAATAVAAMQAVGAVLVAAMVITPGATAFLLTARFGRMMGVAAGIGGTSSFVGAYLSYYLDGATGGCIVTLQTLIFIIVLVFAPKHGLLASRRARQAAIA